MHPVVALLAPQLLHELRERAVAGSDRRQSSLVGELVQEAPRDGVRPVAARVIKEASVAVVVGLPIVREGVLVPTVVEDLGKELVQRPRVAQLVLRDRADRDVLLEQRRDARPLGIHEAGDELVVRHRQQQPREGVAGLRRQRLGGARSGRRPDGAHVGSFERRPPVRSWLSARAAGLAVPARSRAAASLSRIT